MRSHREPQKVPVSELEAYVGDQFINAEGVKARLVRIEYPVPEEARLYLDNGAHVDCFLRSHFYLQAVSEGTWRIV